MILSHLLRYKHMIFYITKKETSLAESK